MSEEKVQADEWIPSSGKKPDLPDGSRVDVKFLDGYTESGRSADFLVWTQDGDPDDITHYRIHRPALAVQEEPLRHPATPSFLEYPSFDEAANFDPVPRCMDLPSPDVETLMDALEGAARSLETISRQAGIDEYMSDFSEVRGYARNRAMVAFTALAALKNRVSRAV